LDYSWHEFWTLIFFLFADRLRTDRRTGRDDGENHATLKVEDSYSSDSAQDRIPLEIGDSKKLLVFYETAFQALQQLNCRQIAKVFIRVIEPRKQVKHPYNGGKPPPGSAPGEKGDPEKTKPDWWPKGVTHKEPDHLKKPGIMTLKNQYDLKLDTG
jgi:hypothetical protein